MAGTLREPEGQIQPGASPIFAARVRAALDEIRPGLIADGGNVELISVEDDGTVAVTLQGACGDCPASELTMERVVAPFLSRAVPGVKTVIAV
jgi:Fe-S cluster biogenesis protein NfuA